MLVFLAGCAETPLPTPPTPEVIIPERIVTNKDLKQEPTDVLAQQIFHDLEHLTTGDEAGVRLIKHYNVDTEKWEEKPVYQLQRSAVKLPSYHSDIIVSVRDVYHDGTTDLEIRRVAKKEIRVYRDLPPFGTLDSYEECRRRPYHVVVCVGQSCSGSDKTEYFACNGKEISPKVKEAFNTLVARVHNSLNEATPLDKQDYHYMELEFILERSEAVINLAGTKSPYK